MIGERPSPQTQHLAVARTLLAAVVLAVTAWVLGHPPRPELPLGAVDGEALVVFVRNGLQLVITVGVWYLLLAIGMHLLAGLPGPSRALRPLADRLLGVGIGVLLKRVIASSTVAGVALPTAVAAEAPAPPEEPPLMVPVDPAALEADATPAALESGTHSNPPVMRRPAAQDTQRPATGPTTTIAVDSAPAHTAPTMHRVPAAPATADGSEQSAEESVAFSDSASRQSRSHHRVEPGESFWSIAEGLARSESDAGGDPAIEDVAQIWQQLVHHNADRLVDPGNPDLLHVGQLIDTRLR